MARLATPDGLGGWDWGGLGFDDVIVVLSEGRPTVVEAGSGSVAARLSTAVAGEVLEDARGPPRTCTVCASMAQYSHTGGSTRE